MAEGNSRSYAPVVSEYVLQDGSEGDYNHHQQKKESKLLSWKEVDAVYREPYILSGYRPPGLSYLQCVQHVFVLHNEVGNFWTHFISFLVSVVWLIAVAVTMDRFGESFYYPMLCFWAGACCYQLFSAIAHLFSCKSFLVRTVCFILDYTGIAMYAFGVDIISLFNWSAATSPVFKYKHVILIFEMCMAVLATLFSALSRFYWTDYRFIIRVLSYAIPYLCALLPFMHRQYMCLWFGSDCVPETALYHALSIICTFLLVFFFVTKIPERFAPGKFDTLLQSHQLFHMFSSALTAVQMYLIPQEIQLRKEILLTVVGASPTWKTTFLPFLCAGILCLCVLVVVAVLVKMDILTNNKTKIKSN